MLVLGVSLALLMILLVRCFSYTPHASFSEMFLLHCSSNDDTEIIPDVIHCPNKDARARSDRLQLGTAHIQSFTQTRQVSVVMGMTRFGAAIGS